MNSINSNIKAKITDEIFYLSQRSEWHFGFGQILGSLDRGIHSCPHLLHLTLVTLIFGITNNTLNTTYTLCYNVDRKTYIVSR